MQTVLTRRRLLSAGAATLTAAALPRLVRGQSLGALSVTELDADLIQIQGAGANVVAFGAGDGVLLVDGGLSRHSAELFALLEAHWPARRVQVLFNTNWREEHSGANATANGVGAKIMAHENTKLWLGGDFFVEWEDRHYSPQPASMLPNDTFYTSGRIEFGGKSVEYRYLPRAHTDGDIAVFFPHANLLVASDLLSVGHYPVPDYATGGWIGGLYAATETLLQATDARTRIVAAEGPVRSRSDLEAQLEMCKTVRSKTAEAYRVGMSFNDYVESRPTAAFDARWGDPSLFLRLVYKGAFPHIRELGGVI